MRTEPPDAPLLMAELDSYGRRRTGGTVDVPDALLAAARGRRRGDAFRRVGLGAAVLAAAVVLVRVGVQSGGVNTVAPRIAETTPAPESPALAHGPIAADARRVLSAGGDAEGVLAEVLNAAPATGGSVEASGLAVFSEVRRVLGEDPPRDARPGPLP